MVYKLVVFIETVYRSRNFLLVNMYIVLQNNYSFKLSKIKWMLRVYPVG